MNELINRLPPLNKKELFARMREIIALGATEMPAIPRYKGTDDSANKVLACKSCNNRKDNMTLEEYRSRLQHQLGEPVVFFGERV